MSDESESVSSTRGLTPDDLLHTGATDNPSAEDLVLASGRDLTPANLQWAERTLAREGRAALDKRLP
ncbi:MULTISPECIES: hypothetical protein [unclassified Streptomyces]|uniref:hypothetical protein n=1 Tax=unclassified Streptomyces TaxID=2593676 RepID=UPI002E81070F|nr:hypothetical protein [Streptomyces sp. NBC_00523]WUC98636.1 hypothetical protein OHS17_02770 [Streptomyces sp. NBC_00523]